MGPLIRGLLLLWQAPQVLLGVVLSLAVWGRIAERRRIGPAHLYLVFWSWGGISLGPLVFLHRNAPTQLIKHELGHSIQSRMLGPLYLVVIGLPSLLWAAAAYPLLQRHLSYDWLFCERWATRLGRSIVL